MPPKLLLVTDLSGRSHPGAGRRPWAWLLATLGIVLFIELLLTLCAPSSPPEPTLADDLPTARAALSRAKTHPNGWLLLGDSVLAGDVMEGIVPAWTEHRVLDYLRREQSPKAPVGFEQVALDGMLPVDMLQILRELDTLDPSGRVGVVLEINPRYFSSHYAEQRECTREFLCELGRKPSQRWRWWWPVQSRHEGWRWLTEHLPIVRHRDRFPRWGEPQRDALIPPPTRLLTAEDPLVGRARILEHYRGLLVDRRSIQFRALTAAVKLLRERGRRAVLFATPLRDEFMAGTLDDWVYGDVIANLDEMINRPGDRSVRFFSLDHPRLTDPSFIDHAHLRAEGNRWLAINLLHQLGVGLAEVPAPGMLAYEEGPDRSLLGRVDQGFSEGAPWQAGLLEPHGLAVAPGGGRLVLADTGNHVVSEMTGTLQGVHLLAGITGTPGYLNGVRTKAQFESPRLPVLVGERVYVVDGKKRQRIREIVGRHVRTIKPKGGERWARIDRIRSDGHSLWLIDRGHRVLRVDPRTGQASLRLDSLGPLSAIDVGPDGRVYLADSSARLWQLNPGEPEPVLLFANTSDVLLPQATRLHFPFSFDELGLERVVDLRYVDRYDALLVQDLQGRNPIDSTVSERAHLRLLSPRTGKIYPWVHPLAHGGGQIFLNEHTRELSSYLHRGSMALDQQTGTLFYLERDRSRLLALGDGLFGTSKLGHHITATAYGGLRDVFGLSAGRNTMLEHHPERWAHQRLEPIPRRGPYLGLMVGSSMTSVTEVVGQYSMARVIERSLTRALGVRDGLRFDLVQRALRGPRLHHLSDRFELFVEHQSPVDVVFFEVHSGRMFTRYENQAAMVEEVDRIRRAAARYDTLVVVIDNDAMISLERDGLRTTGPRLREFLQLCEGAGFVVLRPSDLLLREAIDHAPWGNAPFSGGHGSTWSVDLTAGVVAQQSYARIREHFSGRTPALQRPRTDAIDTSEPLYEVFTEAGDGWAILADRVPEDAIGRHPDGDRLELLVDLGKAGADPEPSAQQRDRLVLSTLVHVLLRDPVGRLANEVSIGLVNFSNYDEYGVGVLDGAEVIDRRELDREALGVFLEMMSARAAAATSPP